MSTLHGSPAATVVLRTSELAARAGCSPQLVRNLERDGVLPAVPRTPSGYRCYTARHLDLVLLHRVLAVALGPVGSKQLLRRVAADGREQALARWDELHAELHAERIRLAAASRAAALVAAEPVAGAPADWMGVSELAGALGVRASALRHWEAEGLVVPDRWSSRRIRRYSPAQARDARIVQQLRAAGHRIAALQTLLPELRAGRRQHSLEQALAERGHELTRRSEALVRAARFLPAVLAPAEDAGSHYGSHDAGSHDPG